MSCALQARELTYTYEDGTPALDKVSFQANAGEITGGPFLSKRFGGWRNVVAAAGLPQPRRQKPIASRQIFREEFKRQMELYAQELQAGEHPGENSKP